MYCVILPCSSKLGDDKQRDEDADEEPVHVWKVRLLVQKLSVCTAVALWLWSTLRRWRVSPSPLGSTWWVYNVCACLMFRQRFRDQQLQMQTQ